MAEADPAAQDVTSPPDSGQQLVRQGAPAPTGDADPGRKELVEQWQKKIKDRRAKLEPEFKKMRENQMFARLGDDKEWVEGGNYVVPVTVRTINQKVARLYARNPQVSAEVRRQVLFSVWDGDPQTLMSAIEQVGQGRMAMQAAEMAGDMAGFEMAAQSINPEAAAIVEEVEQVKREQLLLQRIADTAEILGNYFLQDQSPNFKKSFKQLIRRTAVCKIGYVDLSYERVMAPNPAVTAQLESSTSQMKRVEALLEDATEGKVEEFTAEAERLRTLIDTLQKQPEIIVREGPVLDFPTSDEVWSDEDTRVLDGFIGSRWVVRQFMKTPEDIRALFNKDIGDQFTPYFKKQPGTKQDGTKGQVCLWRVQDKELGQEFYLADGYCDFLREPGPPEVSLERFFTVYTLVFNGVESDETLYAPSDVELMRPAQKELNRSRQDLKDHRRASLPRYVAAGSSMDKRETTSILDYPAHAIIKLKQLLIGQKVTDLLQPLPLVKPDAALYDTRPQMDDIMRSVGSQDANFGNAGSDTTATEASIAEASRSADMASNVDEVDELLSELASGINELNLMYMSGDTVREIAGAKAVWPEHNRAEAVKKITLRVRAGSSGRPNVAADLANLERATPYLLQMPGVNMTPVANRYGDLLNLPVDQMKAEGAPSAVTLNSIMQRMAAPPAPANDKGKPGAPRQGGEGQRQAAHPAPGEQGIEQQRGPVAA